MGLADGKENAEQAAVKAAPVVKETDFLFDKSFTCPVCGGKVKARTLRSGKARMLRTDQDLRPVYNNIEPLKYEPVVCTGCGYSALARYFPTVLPSQIKEIEENICKGFQANIQDQETYTYEEALYRYKLCLANAIVKKGKASENAYICLKMGWLYRSWQDNLIASGEAEDSEKIAELKKQETDFLKKAMESFFEARQTEDYPMCGMDEPTADYLVSVLAAEFDELDIASKIISSIITSPLANNRMKDKARDVKDMIVAKMKEKNEK